VTAPLAGIDVLLLDLYASRRGRRGDRPDFGCPSRRGMTPPVRPALSKSDRLRLAPRVRRDPGSVDRDPLEVRDVLGLAGRAGATDEIDAFP